AMGMRGAGCEVVRCRRAARCAAVGMRGAGCEVVRCRRAARCAAVGRIVPFAWWCGGRVIDTE
ncbi:MAG: hypothetical protein ACUVSW_15380, partial [Roseiflexus sp.]